MPDSLDRLISSADGSNAELFDPVQGSRAVSKSMRRQQRKAEKRTCFEAGRLPPLAGKTPGQSRALKILQFSADNLGGIFMVGPAGSGKTFLSVALGAQLVAAGRFSQLLLCRPTVDAGEKLGFLPGRLGQKLEPWMVPMYDAVDKVVGRAKRESWERTGVLTACSFQHMQGRTFEDAFVVLDEAQNTTPFQMETFLTRMHATSAYSVCGDPFAQQAIEGPSGMVRALQLIRLKSLPVPIVRLTHEDVVRGPHARMWGEAFAGDHEEIDGAFDEHAAEATRQLLAGD